MKDHGYLTDEQIHRLQERFQLFALKFNSLRNKASAIRLIADNNRFTGLKLIAEDLDNDVAILKEYGDMFNRDIEGMRNGNVKNND